MHKTLIRVRILQLVSYPLTLGLGIVSPFLPFPLAITIIVAISTVFTMYWLQGRFMGIIEIWLIPLLFYSGFIVGSVISFILHLLKTLQI